MTAITFDIHKFVRTLKDAGVLATKRDIDARFIQTEQRLAIKLGGLMAISIGVVAGCFEQGGNQLGKHHPQRRKCHLALRLGGFIPALPGF